MQAGALRDLRHARRVRSETRDGGVTIWGLGSRRPQARSSSSARAAAHKKASQVAICIRLERIMLVITEERGSCYAWTSSMVGAHKACKGENDKTYPQ
jgi:hypothetical protein